MGSSPSKDVQVRSRSGLSFVSTSSTESIDTIATNAEEGPEEVKNFVFDEIAVKSFRVGWDPPDNFNPVSYQVRLFPPDHIKSRTLLRALPEPKHTFTRLKSCTQYSVAVIAMDVNKNNSPCATANVWTLPRPPRDIQFPSNTRSDSLQVTWKHCKGKAGTYNVSVTAEGEQVPVATATGLKQTSRLFKDLMPGIEYSVTVTNVMNGQSSEPLTGTFMTAPHYVSDITFSDVTQHDMTLKWKRPEGNVDSYSLELSENTWQPGKPTLIEGLKKTFYTFNGLTPGRLYNCKIVTIAQHKSSKPQTFSECTVPLEVAGIATRDIGPEEAMVTWSIASGDADNYDLFLTPKDGVIGETSPRGVAKTQYQFTGLVPGTVYTVDIVTNSKDKSSKRAVASFVTPPGMCGDLEVSATERSCTTQRIDWPAAGGRVDSYMISIRRDDRQEDGWTIKDIFQPNHLLTQLTPGTLYRVEVAAMREGRESSTVSKVFGTVPSPVPSIYFPKDGCLWDQITCSWEASVGGVQSYLIEAKSEGETSKVADVLSDSADYIFTSLHPATVYEFSVTAVSNEVMSDPKKAKQITGPASVGDLSANPNIKRELTVSWTAPHQGADEYLLKLTSLEDESMQHPLEVATSKQEHNFSGLIPGLLYKVEITPVSSSIRGKPSSVEVYTKPGDILNVHIPEDLITLSSITIKWWGVEGNCKDVDVILSRLQKCEDEDSNIKPLVIKEEHINAKDSGASEVIFADLESDTVYGIRLRAVGKAGVGNDAVFTQSTLAPVKVVEEKVCEEKTEDPVVAVAETFVEESQPIKENESKPDLDAVQQEVTSTEKDEQPPTETPPTVDDTQLPDTPLENSPSATEELPPTESLNNDISTPPPDSVLPLDNQGVIEDVAPVDAELVSTEETKPSTPPTEKKEEEVSTTSNPSENETESKPKEEILAVVETVDTEISNNGEESTKQEVLPSSTKEVSESTTVTPQVNPPELEEDKDEPASTEMVIAATQSPPIDEIPKSEDVIPPQEESTDKENDTDNQDNLKNDVKEDEVKKEVQPSPSLEIHPVFVLPNKQDASLEKGKNHIAEKDHHVQNSTEDDRPSALQKLHADSNTASPISERKGENQLAFLASLTSDD